MLIWLWLILALAFLRDALRMRARAAAIPKIAPSDAPPSADHRFLWAPGVELDDATRRAASAHARARGLEVLDLVPHGLPAFRAWGLLQFFDPDAYRKDRLANGWSFGHAVLADAAVLARAGIEAGPQRDALALVRAVGRLKRYACTSTDAALAPGLRAVPDDPRRRLEMLRELIGGGANVVLVGVPVVIGLAVLAGVTGGIPGRITIGVLHLQLLLALAGTGLGARGLALVTLLRVPIELVAWLRLALERPPAPEAGALTAQRAEYDRLLATGLDPFFEPRTERCPVCGSGELTRRLRTGDLLQDKPGRFALERCKSCDHVFQNPRLSIQGLDFYYKDFYDGLGADNLDRIFGAAGQQYLERARMVKGRAEPSRWLDVGGGHGHFCCAAREVWPGTRFDGLDLSESIDEAVRRGWVDKGYRGLFPDLAGEMTGAYDVVSMSHYLEHTREPQAEIEAAAKALTGGGLLLIEVPDPDCPLGRLLGRFWLPWFQPQHQHLLSVKNLERLLRERGFSPEVWHRGEAHQRVDFLAAVILFLNAVVPATGVPWRPARGRAWGALRSTLWTLSFPALIVARFVDEVLGAVIARTRGSNTYRVLARKG